MTISRANIEAALVYRLGPLMTKASMDGTTVDGTNVNLGASIGWALRTAGYTTALINAPTTAEVAAADDAADELLDLAEMRTLEDILGNLDDVDTTVGPRSERLSQLAAQVEKRLDRVKDRLADLYDHGAPVLTTGTLTYEFAEHES